MLVLLKLWSVAFTFYVYFVPKIIINISCLTFINFKTLSCFEGYKYETNFTLRISVNR